MRMLLFWLALMPAFAFAQGVQPDLKVELNTDSVTVGEPVVMRVTVLVPTYLPDPPKFPGFEIPNLMVRLPERASGPASGNVDGETWSGVTRAYRLYPMTRGTFTIPPRTITVSFADPGTNETVVTEVRTGEVVFDGVVPEAAEGMEPFIPAASLSLDQVIEGEPARLAAGDAVVRIVTAEIGGASPLFIPPLIPVISAEGVAAYADEPVVEESAERGVLSGSRRERVTYVPGAGGRTQLPEITLEWFNTESGKVETAVVPGFDIVASGPAISSVAEEVDWRRLGVWAVLAVLGLVALGAGLRFAAPLLAEWWRARKRAWLASEEFAFKRVEQALHSRDVAGVYQSLSVWNGRLPVSAKKAESRLASAVSALGAGPYGRGEARLPEQLWRDAIEALRAVRSERLALSNDSARHGLPPLNP